MFRLSLSRPSFSLKYSSEHSVPVKYSACSTAMTYHKMYILTQFNLSISHLSVCMKKLWSKFSTESAYVYCAIFVICNSFFQVDSSPACLLYQNKTKKKWVTIKIYFTNWLKFLHLSTRLKYPSSVCVA